MFDFDTPIERRSTGASKWVEYPEDVIPMWVADMDFRSPPAVVEALKQRSEHGVFGYTRVTNELYEVVLARLKKKYAWQVEREHVLFVPGLVSAFNVCCRAFADRSDEVVAFTPAYPPFLDAPRHSEQVLITVPLKERRDGPTLRYALDFDAFEAAITKRTKIVLFSNPHNPVGHVFTKEELRQFEDICARHELLICSDEIHSDLILEGAHVPLAMISQEIAARTITLMSASKTFNLAGLNCGYVIFPSSEMRERFEEVAEGFLPHHNIFGLTATLAAYKGGEEWLRELLVYLKANRDFATDFMHRKLPQFPITTPAGTYLAWLDLRSLGAEDPQRYFLERARVAMSTGARFGLGYESYVRLNFGCPRSQLAEALERIVGSVS